MKHNIVRSWKLVVADWIVCFAALAAPLWVGVIHNWHPHVMAKVALITAATIAIACLYFWYGLTDGKNESSLFKITWMHGALFLFLVILGVSSLFSVSPIISFFGSFDRGMSVSLFATVSVFLVILAELINRNTKLVKNLFYCMFISSLINAVFTYVGVSGLYHIVLWNLTDANASLFLGSSSFLGPILAFGMFSGIYLFSVAQKRSEKIFLAISMLVIALCPNFFHTTLLLCKNVFSWLLHNPLDVIGDANGAVIGFAFGLVVTFFVFLSLSEKKKISILGTIGVIMVMISSLYIGARFLNPSTSIHQKYAEVKTSNRFYFWDIARKAGNEKPLLGYGYNSYEYVYGKNFDGTVFKKGYAPEKWVDRPHNTLFEYFAAGGYPVLVSYLAFFAVALVGIYRMKLDIKNNRLLSSLLSGALVSYLIQSLFVFDMPVTLLYLFIFCAFAIFGFEELRVSKSLNSYLFSKKIFLSSAIAVSAVAFVVLVVLPVRESNAWYYAIRNVTLKGYSEKVKGIGKIYPVGTPSEDALYGVEFSKIINSSLAQITQKNKKYFISSMKSVYEKLEKDFENNPENFRLAYSLGRTSHIYSLTLLATDGSSEGQRDLLVRSKEVLNRAIEINPNYAEPYFEISQVESLLGDSKKALMSMQKANDIDPNSIKQFKLIKGEKVLVPDEKSFMLIGEGVKTDACREFKK